MQVIDLIYSHHRLSDQVNRLIRDCAELGSEIGARPAGRGAIEQFEPADGMISWNLLNSVARQLFPDRQPVFCEWGSGLGLVSLMASSMGMSATGIEIEEELVDLSRDLAVQHAIPASFIHGSIYPDQQQASALIDYAEVDLFFAYPWPAQITGMTALFEQVATAGAIYLSYHGGQNFRVVQR